MVPSGGSGSGVGLAGQRIADFVSRISTSRSVAPAMVCTVPKISEIEASAFVAISA
jgi:hypothetical protein